ncbi:MAG: PIN domain-containing protein [Candidatus Riflebacteria bacterium]|nr:PIN domain-containing protein [Candidatus Riflebacteria bacterium]
MILIDTPIWSMAFRRSNPLSSSIVDEITELIKDCRAGIIGPIRQEILSGYSDKNKFCILKEKLDAFPNIPIEAKDYIKAAEFNNACRVAGIQGSHIDFLICSVASRLNIQIFTDDKDFEHYAKHLPIKLYKVKH